MVFYKGFIMVRGDVLFMTRFQYGFDKLNDLCRRYTHLNYSMRYLNSDEEDTQMFRELIADIRDLANELDNVEMTITSFSISQDSYEEWLDRQKREMEAALVAAHVLKDKDFNPPKDLENKVSLEVYPSLLFFPKDGQEEEDFWEIYTKEGE